MPKEVKPKECEHGAPKGTDCKACNQKPVEAAGRAEKDPDGKKAPEDVPRYVDEITRSMNPRRALIAKLAKILGEVSRIPKTGWNDFHKYNYVTESDVLDTVRMKLAEAGIFIFSSQEECNSRDVRRMKDNKEVISHGTLVKVRYTFDDGDAQVSVSAYGDSEDTGDKGLYKAVTGAYKYFLLKNFMMPTGEDPERDSPERNGARGGKAAAKTPAGKPAQQGQQQEAPKPVPVKKTIEAQIFAILESQNEATRKAGWKGIQIGEEETELLRSKDPAVLGNCKNFVGSGEPLLMEIEETPGSQVPPILLSLTLKHIPGQ